MSKHHKIRWTQSDNDDLARALRNFNAKITRISKKNPEIKNYLPEKVRLKGYTNEKGVYIPGLKDLINTRQDLHREINALRRFSKRGSEEIVVIPDTDYNVKTTKWQKTEMNRRKAIINRRRKKRYEEMQEIELKSGGESLGYTKGQFGMGKTIEIDLRPINAFTRRMNQKDLIWKWRSMMAESQSDYFTKKDYQARENYLQGIYENYNPEDLKDVIDHIKNMDIKEFLNTMQSEDPNFEFASFRPDEDKYKSYVTHMKSIWLPNKN